MKSAPNVTPGQFSLFRVLFGAYLAIHFATQLPHARELFSNQGVLPDPRLNPLYGIFPDPLSAWGSPGFTTFFITGLLALSLTFAAGFWRRTSALLLWFGWAALFNRNNLIANPSIAYVGVTLLFCAVIPAGEPWSLSAKHVRPSHWQFPAAAFWGAWLLMAAGYSASGYIKLSSPSWLDGTAFRHLLDNPLARPGIARDMLLRLPDSVHAALTWGALAMELLFLPLCIIRVGRLIAWTAMAAMHLGILVTVDFADLSFGMVMIHLFTFDARWFPPRRDGRQPVLLYDGDCGLCNAVLRFLMREDATARMNFAPLQSPAGQEFLRYHGMSTTDFDSLVFVPDWSAPRSPVFKIRTNGVLAALDEIGGVWRVFTALRIVPAPLRDPLYKIIARARYRLFGGYRPSPYPEPEWADRILQSPNNHLRVSPSDVTT